MCHSGIVGRPFGLAIDRWKRRVSISFRSVTVCVCSKSHINWPWISRSRSRTRCVVLISLMPLPTSYRSVKTAWLYLFSFGRSMPMFKIAHQMTFDFKVKVTHERCHSHIVWCPFRLAIDQWKRRVFISFRSATVSVYPKSQIKWPWISRSRSRTTYIIFVSLYARQDYLPISENRMSLSLFVWPQYHQDRQTDRQTDTDRQTPAA
jgi:hypothetical protein